ncbi:MAG TPA: metallophosphoesterase [Terriglobales bacterium]
MLLVSICTMIACGGRFPSHLGKVVDLPSNTPLLAAAGDIACDPNSSFFHNGRGDRTHCHMKATSDLVLSLKPTAVLALGDTQYETGSPSAYARSYGPTWGRFKAITHPVLGNHEDRTSRASGYFNYFGDAAGTPGQGYYSFNLQSWHLIALNSNCNRVGGCGEGSPELEWLKKDLAANHSACILAFWHHPRFSSGLHGSNRELEPFWNALYDAGADVVLVGHDHDYERFAPLTPAGRLDEKRGIRQFVVGTGGKNQRGFLHFVPALGYNSRFSEARFLSFGVIEMELAPNFYVWKFIAENGKVLDSGSAACHIGAADHK